MGGRVGGAAGARPFRMWHIGQLPMAGEKIVAVRQRGDLGNDLQVAFVGKVHHLLHFSFFQEPAIPRVVMRRVPEVASWPQCGIASRVVQAFGKLDPAGVDLRVPIEPHAGIGFYDECVEFVERHEITHEPSEETQILTSRDVKPYATEWLVWPVPDTHPGYSQAAFPLVQQLPERLQSVECTSLLASGNHQAPIPSLEHISFGTGILCRDIDRVLSAVLPHQGVGERAHQDIVIVFR